MDTLLVINIVLNVSLMFVAVIGNTLVLSAIFRTPSIHSSSSIFLSSLAVSDLLVGLAVQPVYIAHELKPDPGLRKTANILFSMGCVVSLCTMTAISIDRFMALHYHMRYPNLMTNKCAIRTTVTLWLFVIASSFLMLWRTLPIVLAVGIFACLLISAFFYTRIYFIVRHHQSAIHLQQQAVQSMNTAESINIARSKRSALSTFIYFICLVLCYSPMFTSMIIYTIDPTLSSNLWTVANTVVFLNSSINPFLYCWRLKELRKAVLKTGQKLLCKQTEERQENELKAY